MNNSIVFIARKFYSGRGNWDRELMKQLAKKSYDVHAITCPFQEQFKDEEQKLANLGVKFHFVNSWNLFLFFIGSVMRLYKIAKESKIILYVPSSKPILFYYPLVKLFKIPIIFSLQGAELKELEIMPEFEHLRKHWLQYKLKRKIVAFQEKISAKLADRIIVISKAIEDELIQLGAPKDKINLIYCAVDINFFKKDIKKKKEIRNKYEIRDNEIVINYTARLSKSDAPTRMWSAEMLIKTFASLNCSNIKIMFVGGGDGIEHLKALSREYDIENRVIFVGFVPHNKVPDYLSASDIFCFVMKDPLPTYGLALQEAMSCENVVITNDSGSMREIIQDSVNGFLVNTNIDEMRDRLEEILQKDDKELGKIKEMARKDVIEKYCWDVVLPKVGSIFNF